MTPRSNAALWATTRSPPIIASISAKISPNRGAAATISGVTPWICTLRGSKWSNPSGGRIIHSRSSTISPARTLITPTLQGDPRKPLAVSKSMAVKS